METSDRFVNSFTKEPDINIEDCDRTHNSSSQTYEKIQFKKLQDQISMQKQKLQRNIKKSFEQQKKMNLEIDGQYNQIKEDIENNLIQQQIFQNNKKILAFIIQIPIEELLLSEDEISQNQNRSGSFLDPLKLNNLERIQELAKFIIREDLYKFLENSNDLNNIKISFLKYVNSDLCEGFVNLDQFGYLTIIQKIQQKIVQCLSLNQDLQNLKYFEMEVQVEIKDEILQQQKNNYRQRSKSNINEKELLLHENQKQNKFEDQKIIEEQKSSVHSGQNQDLSDKIKNIYEINTDISKQEFTLTSQTNTDNCFKQSRLESNKFSQVSNFSGQTPKLNKLNDKLQKIDNENDANVNSFNSQESLSCKALKQKIVLKDELKIRENNQFFLQFLQSQTEQTSLFISTTCFNQKDISLINKYQEINQISQINRNSQNQLHNQNGQRIELLNYSISKLQNGDPILKKKGDKIENARKTIEIWQERNRGVGFNNQRLNQNDFSQRFETTFQPSQTSRSYSQLIPVYAVNSLNKFIYNYQLQLINSQKDLNLNKSQIIENIQDNNDEKVFIYSIGQVSNQLQNDAKKKEFVESIKASLAKQNFVLKNETNYLEKVSNQQQNSEQICSGGLSIEDSDSINKQSHFGTQKNSFVQQESFKNSDFKSPSYSQKFVLEKFYQNNSDEEREKAENRLNLTKNIKKVQEEFIKDLNQQDDQDFLNDDVFMFKKQLNSQKQSFNETNTENQSFKSCVPQTDTSQIIQKEQIEQIQMDNNYQNQNHDLSQSIYEQVNPVIQAVTFQNNHYFEDQDELEMETQISKISKNHLNTIAETDADMILTQISVNQNNNAAKKNEAGKRIMKELIYPQSQFNSLEENKFSSNKKRKISQEARQKQEDQESGRFGQDQKKSNDFKRKMANEDHIKNFNQIKVKKGNKIENQSQGCNCQIPLFNGNKKNTNFKNKDQIKIQFQKDSLIVPVETNKSKSTNSQELLNFYQNNHGPHAQDTIVEYQDIVVKNTDSPYDKKRNFESKNSIQIDQNLKKANGKNKKNECNIF